MDENKIRLESINELIIKTFQSKQPMLLSTAWLLEKIQEIAAAEDPDSMEEQPIKNGLDHVIISCDASIKQNPGGPSAVGFVIQDREKEPQGVSKMTSATTNNQAEYDAVYEALTTYTGLINNPGCLIEIRSDSQIVVKQLRKDMKCNDPQLEKRRDLILELVEALPVPVKFVWRPRNSTIELESANYLAQDLLKVPRH